MRVACSFWCDSQPLSRRRPPASALTSGVVLCAPLTPRQVAETLVPLVLQPPPCRDGDASQQQQQQLQGSQGHQADGEGGSLPEAVAAELREAGVEVVGWVLLIHAQQPRKLASAEVGLRELPFSCST